ncbi:MAG: sulfatase-like hydrolase/transferase, partial [Planctomycetota bacterium]|nr:sulfatase-like hydrolase/transferase [Planctomycetota bacterium]
MRTLLFLLLLSGAPDRRAQEPQAPVEEASPRLLLIDLDDVGFDLLEVTETPFLDQLSENGRRFTRFHSSPLCSPTRARALLGAYGSRPGIALGTIIRRESRYALPLDVYAPLPTVLGAAGKGSAKVGKWHLAPDADLSHPNRAGFESYEGVIGNPSGGSGGDNYYNFPKVTDGDEQRVRERYLTQDETNDALRRVREHTDFVWLSYHAVHKPFHQPPPDLHIAN